MGEQKILVILQQCLKKVYAVTHADNFDGYMTSQFEQR